MGECLDVLDNYRSRAEIVGLGLQCAVTHFSMGGLISQILRYRKVQYLAYLYVLIYPSIYTWVQW